MNLKSLFLLALCLGIGGPRRRLPEIGSRAGRGGPGVPLADRPVRGPEDPPLPGPGVRGPHAGPERAGLLPERGRPLRPRHHLRPELQAQYQDPQDPRRGRPGLQGGPQGPALGRVHDLRQAGLVLQRHPSSLLHGQDPAGIRRRLFRRPGPGNRGPGLPPGRGADPRRPPGLPAAHPLRSRRRRQEGLPGPDQGPGPQLGRELLRGRHPGRGRGLL